jgi:hypothetical protein
MADAMIENSDTTKLFFGEVIGSFRQMLKRQYFAEAVLISEDTAASRVYFTRAAFPEYGGRYNDSDLSTSPVLKYGDGSLYVPNATTMVNYVALAFLGWRGSLRWTFDSSTLNVQGAGDRFNSITYSISRTDDVLRVNDSGALAAALPNNTIVNCLNEESFDPAMGTYLGNTNVNPIQAVEIPFYSNERFVPAITDIPYDTAYPYPGFKYLVNLPGSNSSSEVSFVKTYVSAGEDFNLFFYQGPPPIYRQPVFPSDPGP